MSKAGPGGARRRTATTPAPRSGFKGNKQALAVRTCETCGRPMSWRKAWARNWDQVRHCSEACRRRPKALGAP